MGDRNRPQNPKEAIKRTFEALMRRGEAFPDTVMKEPTGDSRLRMPGAMSGGGPAPPASFTGRHVDRYFLVGCSPYTFLQGTKKGKG